MIQKLWKKKKNTNQEVRKTLNFIIKLAKLSSKSPFNLSMLDGLDMTEINKASKGKHGIYDGLDSLEDALKKGEDLEGALNKFENEEEDVENEEELKKALLLDQQKRDMANKIRELMETQKGNDKGHDIELLVKKFKEGLDRNAELRNAANLVADALNELRDALRSKDPKKNCRGL